ncbi:MAG: divergent polysaccharide deacetylase family protein [Sulfitobacter sp.]
MARGVLSGIGLGAVFSVGVAVVASVLVPIEPRQVPPVDTAENVAAPAPTEPVETQPAPEQDNEPAVASQVEPQPETSEPPQVVTELDTAVQEAAVEPAPVTAPQGEDASTTPSAVSVPATPDGEIDTVPEVPQSPVQPLAGAADDLSTPAPLPAGEAPRAVDDAPVLPNPQALAPMIPDEGVDVAIVPEATQPPQSEAEPETTTAVPVPAPVPVPPVEPAPQTAEVAAPTPSAIPEPEEGTETATLAPQTRTQPLPTVDAQTDTEETRPRIGTPARSIIDRTDAPDDEGAEAASQPDTSASQDKPIAVFAQPFENPDAKPLMSIVLIDTGTDLEAREIGLPALTSFPYPVSFAVDANLLDAAERMARYRSEGFDVLAMVDLPEGALPEDAEVSLEIALGDLDEVVGILEGTGGGLQGSREVADQVTGILKASGHGLVTQNRGLNSMPKLAVKEGVPAAPIFRDFDSEDQQPRVIRRFLDQAAFRAGQEGGVIMLGRLRPETIEALLVWGLADRAGSVALAPVSAVLLGQ